MPGFYHNAKVNINFQKAYYSLKSKNLYKPNMDNRLRKKIIDQVYKDDIIALQVLLNRNLDSWLV